MKKKRFLLLGLLVGLMVLALGVASASAENVTLDPNAKGVNITLSNGNLTAEATCANSVRATVGRASGKWYWECSTTSGPPFMPGVTNCDSNLNYYPGRDVCGWAIAGNGRKYHNATLPSSIAYCSTYDLNDCIGVALDMDTGKLSYYLNGVWQGDAFTGLTGTLYPSVGSNSNSFVCAMNINFGATPFTYPIPAGYKSYDGSQQGSPGAPTNLTATPGDAQVSLSWDAVTDATSYNIKRSTSSATETTIASSVYANYTDTGLTNGTTYYYVVTAVGASTESTNSDEVSATPQESLPNAPTGLTAIADDAQVSLTWENVTGATAYKVKWATAQGGPYTNIIDVIGISYTHSGLTNGTTYYYIVTAVTASGESGNSNEVSAIPQAGSTPPASGNGTLVVTVANNADREYNLTMAQIQAFIDWYNNRSTGGNVYIIEKTATAPYTRVKDYLIFDKIVAWQVKEY